MPSLGLPEAFSLALLLALILTAPDGAAQTRIQEIIVTAQKREQPALEVPVSISTLTGERLTAFFESGSDIRALSTQVPSLYSESSNGRVAPRFYIRGLGNTDFDLGASQPVSIVLDDVVMENVILKSFPVFDLARVEILRGPQGSLFGRNTTAGIVKLESARPTTTATGSGKLTLGALGTRNAEAVVSGPLTADVRGRLALLSHHRDNWVDNGYSGEREFLGNIDDLALKGSIAWQASDQIEVLANARHRALNGTGGVFRANVLDTGSNAFNDNYIRDTVYLDGGNGNPQIYDHTGFTLKLNIRHHDLTFTAISASDTADGFSRGDIDGGFGAAFLPQSGPGFIPFPAETQDSGQVSQFTQELRLASDRGTGLFWQLGAYFFDSQLDVFTVNGFNNQGYDVENQAWALFGQADVALGTRWTSSYGLRYTDDRKDLGSTTQQTASIAGRQFSGKLSLSYAPDDRSVLWARWATGFRGPSIQGRDIAFFGAPSVADSETVTSYELGFRAQWARDQVAVSGAVFHYTVDDPQFSAVGGAGNLIRLVNAAGGSATGFEMEAEYIATRYMTLQFGFAWVDTAIHDPDLEVATCGSGLCTPLDPLRVVVNPDGTSSAFARVDGNRFPNAPQATANVAVQLRHPFAGGEWFALSDWAWQGKTQLFLYESAEYMTDGQFEGGLRAGYRRHRGSGGWEAALFARNLTDEENLLGGVDFNNNTAFDNEPRIWGASLNFSF